MNKNLEIAIEASISAGKAIMEIYDTDFAVDQKEDKSPLTEADRRANSIINQFLQSTGIPIISEENKQIEYEFRKKWSLCWVVDPVDGTKEFIKRNGEFTVNIALVDNGTPMLGVIYAPAFKALYYGDKEGKDAYKVNLPSHKFDLEYIKLNSSKLSTKSKSNQLSLVGSRSHMNEETLNYMNELKEKGQEVEIVSKGSSLKFCLVAEGMADVYPRFAPTMEWDTAAGDAICRAVGVEVISQEDNEPLKYNKENLLNPWFIVKA